ncbi:smoothelin-like protein 1 [Spea bombifrons]|uniref:smoothelin-like protein 1 n=1 Tax=Spea bombifrons TaxID=233779 RepID=UPI00234A3EC2|nr:smoothelin-like protein 1 [Spea bombifrons]
MVEEQSRLLTGDGLKDQENVLLSNEKDSADDIKEVVPSQEMPLKNKADSLAHEDSEAVGQDKKTLDAKGEGQVGNEDNSTVDTKEETTSDVKETMVSNTETAEINSNKDTEEMEKTEDDETSTNSKETPEDTDISQKAKEAEDNTVCKDDETKREDQLLQAEGEQISDDSTTSKSPSEETTSESATKAKIPPPAKAPSKEKEHPERKQDLPRSKTMPKSYGRATRKDIAEKFGGVGTSGVRVQRSTSCGASAVKNMLLEWCRAKTKGYEGVDIQNFSSSWSNGLAFCSLMHAFFPDAFDYDSLDPKKRRENFQLAFNTAENLADCPPLLDVEDMVRMKVPDSKCVYTYVQELYRSLVAKGLVKTKKA